MKKNYFVTGTDTDCGKTLITEALLVKARQKGLRTLGLKPVAAGAELTQEGWRNSDAICLQQASTEQLPYAQINPVLLEMPIAPHLAAAIQGKRITISSLAGFVRGAMLHPADLRLIEGAGGWMVPVNERELLADLPKVLGVDVILVVGLKLGCINHALLTARVIRHDGLHIAGWVANQIDPAMQFADENVEALKKMLGAPFMGFVPYLPGITGEKAAEYVHFFD